MAAHKNSTMSNLKGLQVGGHFYFETTTAEKAVNLTKYLASTTRYPKEMEGFKLKTKTMTATGAKFGDVVFLVRVERLS